jgi:Holliday junction DNA helicase RuvB
MIERAVQATGLPEDQGNALRPATLGGFVGQRRFVANMRVFMTAAKGRRESLDHVLLSGPPGLGKTTFAHLVARELGAPLKATSAPVIEKTGDMAALLSSLQEGEILFIDEIHRLKPVVEEVLYPALEDFALDLQLGQGPTARTVKIALPKFTLVGATTRPGSLTAPLLSRFGILGQFEFYGVDDLSVIARRNACILGLVLAESGVGELARRCRGTPRILNRLLRRVRDFAQVKSVADVDAELCAWSLDQMEIDRFGLDALDRRLLETLIRSFGGGPVGLDNLAVSLGEDSETLEDMVEPYLIQAGFLQRTPRGRIATRQAYQYLGLKGGEPSLFDPPANSP